MKTTKRILSVFLTLALALTLALPALAAAPVITGITPARPVARTGKNLTLTVTAQGEGLSYQWYQWIDDDWAIIPGATSGSLTVTATIEEFVPAFEDGVFGAIAGYFAGFTGLLIGLRKQYRVMVSCGEGETYREITAVFVPGLLDSCRGFYQLYEALALNLGPQLMGEDIIDNLIAVMTICKFFTYPLLWLMGAMLWPFGSMMYYIQLIF